MRGSEGRRGESWIFHLLARVVEFHGKLADVDQLGLYVRTFLCLLKNKGRSVFASPSLLRP